MKSFREYLIETELSETSPTVGDIFELEIARDETLIETIIVDIVEDGIVIEADDTTLQILRHVNYLSEDSNMPTARDSISPIYSNVREEYNDEYGETEDRGFFVAIGSEDEGAFVGMVVPEGGEWRERPVAGNPPANWGQRYMGYLEPNDVMKWIEKDYGQYAHVAGPFSDESEAMDYARNYFDMDSGDDYEDDLDEAKYRGREVPLGKKMKGDVKKSKVYVRKPNGNIVKVEFGDPNMRIKKSNPKRRKSFRARLHCENPGPRWKARYWSCRSW